MRSRRACHHSQIESRCVSSSILVRWSANVTMPADSLPGDGVGLLTQLLLGSVQYGRGGSLLENGSFSRRRPIKSW